MIASDIEAAPQPDLSHAPKISIVATVRNERSTIRVFVDSLLQQTLSPDEIIIVDGASTDGTTEILTEYAAAEHIRLISQDCNIAQGRNLGIRHARNEVVAITDAGCRVDSMWLRRISECFASPERPDVVAGNFAFDCHSDFERAVVYATFSPARESSQSARYYPSSRSVAFRKSAWKAVGGYPEWLYAAEDTLLNVRLRHLGYRFVFCKDAVVHWRPRESWGKLAKQRFNFSRGNARVGIATAGYITNIEFHAAAVLLLAAGSLWWPLALGGLLVLVEHFRRHLWTQATQVRRTTASTAMFFRVLAVMEFVRIVNIFGFLAGRLDRTLTPSFKERQREWMGASSLDDLRDFTVHAHHDESRALRRARRKVRVLATGLPALLLVGALALVAADSSAIGSATAVLAVALGYSVALLAKSFYDFSQTGPPLRREILRNYRIYSVFALLRLSFWAFALCTAMAALGVAIYAALSILSGGQFHFQIALAAAILGVFAITGFQFSRHLLYLPASIAASSHYRLSRLYSLWRLLTPGRLRAVQALVGATSTTLFTACAWVLVSRNEYVPGAGFAILALIAPFTVLARFAERESPPVRSGRARTPNILMIGSDTLRADRVGGEGYSRNLTPFIDSLASRGTRFSACYVTCARTAPSLLSMMTGTWPHRHGVRDNFVGDDETQLPVAGLATLLTRHGYRTAAIGDWSAGDLGKFPLGFESVDVPADQWNIKYLIRQGPKDLRLFLSLFTHNAFGKWLLPELYYLAGVPLTSLVGRDARTLISRFAERGGPFFLNVFISTTHPPFGSEYPYYTQWSDKNYAGESKFVMARLTDPWEIIRRQADTKKDFDLDQVIDLYDGCVQNFDSEVKRIVEHVKACGLEDDTIIVIYSDHGMEFFEHGTWGQGNSVRGDASARIPLVIVDPKIKGGEICPHVVRSIDVAPTLLELAGIEPQEDMDGVSLVPYLKGEATDLNLPAFAETGIWLADLPGMSDDHLRYPNLLELLEVPEKQSGTLAIKPQYRRIVIEAKDRMVRVGRWKLIYQPTTNGPRHMLFDVSTDPDCRFDVAAKHPDVAEDLEAHLACWLAGTQRQPDEQGTTKRSHEPDGLEMPPRGEVVDRSQPAVTARSRRLENPDGSQ